MISGCPGGLDGQQLISQFPNKSHGIESSLRGIVHRELIVGEERGERVTVVVTGAGRGEGGGGAETDDG